MPTTTWKPPTPDLPTTTVIRDRWDRKWHENADAKITRLHELTEGLTQEHGEPGRDVMADLWSILSKAEPKVADEVRPDRAVNRMVAEMLLESDGVRDLRPHTRGSQVQTALGCISMAPMLDELYNGALAEAQRKAEEAQRKADRVTELMAGGAGSPGGGADGVGEEQDDDGSELAEAMAEAAQAAQELDDALGEAAAAAGHELRQAADQAATETQERADAMAAWGTEPGQIARMDPDEYLALAEKLTTPDLREVARILGAMRNLAIGARKESVETVPTEVVDVELGNDISRVLPGELLGLIVPELEDDFFRRYAGRQLLQYKLHSVDPVAKGGIILLEDSSGSMSGEKHLWAKALGLALGSIARDDDRPFTAIEFGSDGEARWHYFETAADWTTEKRLTYARSFLNGGTSFEWALSKALREIRLEHGRTGKVESDVVLLTDGISDVRQQWLEGFLEAQEEYRFRIYCLLVGTSADSTPQTIRKFSNYIGEVHSFTDGSDASGLFRAINP